MTELLRGEKIHKYYGKVHALKGINLEVEKGEVLGIIGDNGAGKSTLIKILSGVLQPTKGKLYWKGKETKIDSVKKAREMGIETVHQEGGLVKIQSIARNIFMGKNCPKDTGFVNYDEMNERSKSRLESLNLNLDPETDVRFCSGGERQGVAIARALEFEAELVMLDEPTTNLPEKSIEKVFDLVKKLRDKDITTIIISHEIRSIYPIIERVTLLDDGDKIGEARKEDITVEEIENAQLEGEL